MQPLLRRPHGADLTWHHSTIAGHNCTSLWACSGGPSGSWGHSHCCPWFSAQCETKQRIPPPVRSLDHTLLQVLLGPTALQSFYCKYTFHFCSQPSLSLGLMLETTTPGRGQSEVNVPRSRTPSLGTWVCLAPSSFRVSSLLRGHSFHIQVELGYFVWLFSKNGWSSIHPRSFSTSDSQTLPHGHLYRNSQCPGRTQTRRAWMDLRHQCFWTASKWF